MTKHSSWLARLLWLRRAAVLDGTGTGFRGRRGDRCRPGLARQQSQPLNNAPVWREVRSGDQHVTTVKGVETGVLIQSGGQTWRALRNGPVMLYGGIAFCAMLVLLAVFFKLRGPIMLSGAKTGR
jgi:formate dehydrogenase subunit gamma